MDAKGANLKARAEIQDREWVELELTLNEGVVADVKWHAWGCEKLLHAASEFVQKIRQEKLDKFEWAPGQNNHWDLLLREVLERLKGQFHIPYEEEELCHCRKIPLKKVDEAIVLGAHSPEKVRAWTTASSGCGTCRPDVEKVIQYRLKKVSG